MQPYDRRLIPLASIAPRKMQWLWADRIPIGAITILDGDPGNGKSTITYDLAARVSSGLAMPLCKRADPPAGVILLQAEDDLAATVLPRLRAAKADISRIQVYDAAQFGTKPLVLPDDISALEVAAGNVQARLVVIDPLTAFLGGNANNDQSIRRSMSILSEFAQRAQLAVLLVRHLRKSGGTAANRGAGSVGIIAAARSALTVGHDPASTDQYRCICAQTKTNLSTATSLAYRTVKTGDQIGIEWLGESRTAANDLATGGGVDHSALNEAQWVLYSLLTEGPVHAAEVYKLATEAGVCKRTLDRAKQTLCITTRKHGGGKGSQWTWELPQDDEVLRPFRERDRDAFLEPFTYRDKVASDDEGEAVL